MYSEYSAAKNQLGVAARLVWRDEVLLCASRAVLQRVAAPPARRWVLRGAFARAADDERRGQAVFEDRDLIVASGLFDADYYLCENPDVKEAGLDPIEHYLRFGGLEGRRPGPIFDARHYLESHADVREHNVNPLVHFIRHGIAEGREVNLQGDLPYPPSRLEGSSAADPRTVTQSSPLGEIARAGLHLEAAANCAAHDLEELRRLHQRELDEVAAGAEKTELRIYVARSSAQRAALRADRLTLDLAEAESRHASKFQELSAQLDRAVTAAAQDREELKRLHQLELDEVAAQAEQTKVRAYLANSSAQRAAAQANDLGLKLAQAESHHEALVQQLTAHLEARDGQLSDMRGEIKSAAEYTREVEQARDAAVAEAGELRARIEAMHVQQASEIRALQKRLEEAAGGLEANEVERQRLATAIGGLSREHPVPGPSHSLSRVDIIDALARPSTQPAPGTTFDVPLYRKLLYRLAILSGATQIDNIDWMYPPLGITLPQSEYNQYRCEYFVFVTSHWPGFSFASRRLADDRSRELFMELILFRLLGYEHVRLPSNVPEYHEIRRWSDALPSRPSCFSSVPGGRDLGKFAIELGDRKLTLDCLAPNIFFSFGVQQYFYHRDGVSISPSEGDHVVDAGACFGDTAVKMSLSVGSGGRIYSFDPVQTHQEIIRLNLEQNEIENVTLFPFGLSDHDAVGDPPSNRVDPGYSLREPEFSGPSKSLDSLVAEGAIDRVDFIKMDIEGHELAALRGAEQTLRRFKPKLAISFYHRWEDYTEIPRFVVELGLGYRLYLENYTISDGETVLYCAACQS